MAYAYLVTGSEDGPLAICSSRERAVEKAIAYVTDTDIGQEYDMTEGLTHASVYGATCYAYVERFWLE